MTEQFDNLMPHDYDGIQELDNSLPRWWLWLFYFTIAWGIGYLLYFHVFKFGYLQADQYWLEMDPTYVRAAEPNPKLLGIFPEYHTPYYNPERNRAAAIKAAREASSPRIVLTRDTDTTTYFAVDDPARILAGKEIFQRNCATCHGAQGQGGIGPNMTDDYWLHGNGITNITKSIMYGYPDKGMISWRGYLKPNQIQEVASFLQTLRGTNPPNPKAPQGELVTGQ